MPTKGTPPINIRLTPDERERAARIGRRNGLTTTAAAIRHALWYTDESEKKIREKSAKSR